MIRIRNILSKAEGWRCAALLLASCLFAFVTVDAARAHGELNQEPFLRTRTALFYDVNFSLPENATINVNDEVTITGTIRMFSYWPEPVDIPDMVYLNAATSGSVFVKKDSWVNDVVAIQSFATELGRDYEFKLVLQSRLPGNWHVHPMLNVRSAGGMLGPGIFVNVEGNAADFKFPTTTLDGTEIANLETFGTTNVLIWHAFWAVVGLAWLLWWLRRPLLIPRFLMVKDGTREDELVTHTDRIVGFTLLVGTLAVAIGSFIYADFKYPNLIPLQGGKAYIDPLPKPASIPVKLRSATYYVPGRTVLAEVAVTNDTDRPLQIGELATANLRFINKSVASAVAAVPDGYPTELLPNVGLVVDDNTPIAPGETRVLKLDASDVSWEIQRLGALMNDPESAIGALLFFYDDSGKRYMSELFIPLIPVFAK